MSVYKGLRAKKGKMPKGLATYMAKKKRARGAVSQQHGMKPMPKTGNIKPVQAGNNLPSKGLNPFFKKVDKKAKKAKGKLNLRSLKSKKY
jgi:hypothetical protein